METIIDVVSCVLTPYLIYLGELDITPKVLSVEGEEILTIERIQGKRLGDHIREDSVRNPSELYKILGSHIGVISRYGIYHGHLHSDNVFVRTDNHPVIIDWGSASLTLPLDERGEIGLRANGTFIEEDILCYIENSDPIKKLDIGNFFKSGFKKGYSRRDLLSTREIHERARLLLYGTKVP